MTAPSELTAEQAAAVLTAALSAPGGGAAVLRSFADLPGAGFSEGRAGGLLRRAEDARLDVGQWRFVAGERMQVSHVVHQVVLKTSTVGPAQAGRMLAEAVLSVAAESGPSAVDRAQAVLYGMAVVHGLV